MRATCTFVLPLVLAAALASGCSAQAAGDAALSRDASTPAATPASAPAQASQPAALAPAAPASAAGDPAAQPAAAAQPSGASASASTSTPAEQEEWVLVAMDSYDSSGAPTSAYTIDYDTHGNPVAQLTYDAAGELTDAIYTQYTYLDDGRIARELVTDNTGSLYNDLVYDWDPTGYVAYITLTYADGNTSSPRMKAYDDRGRVVEEHNDTYQIYWTYGDTERVQNRYWISHDECTYTVTTLDDQGRTAQKHVYKTQGFRPYTADDLVEYTLYEYAANGLDYTATRYDAAGVPQRLQKCAYEEDGHSYRLTGFLPDGTPGVSTHYVYQPLSQVAVDL